MALLSFNDTSNYEVCKGKDVCLHALQKSDSFVHTSQNAYCASKMVIYWRNALSGFRN